MAGMRDGFFRLIAFFCVLAFLPLGFFLLGCSVKYRDDSAVYSCYYYGIDGVDMTDEIVSYTLELRSDNSLITRYKTQKNSDSGKDEYYFEGDTIVVAAFYGKKVYHHVGNEIIIGEKVDSEFVLIKFRLTQSPSPATADMYSCTAYSVSDRDEIASIRYYITAFYEDGSFAMWLWSKEERLSYQGSFEDFGWGYLATQNEITDDEGNVLPSMQWSFEKTDGALTLTDEQKSSTAIFEKTQSIGDKLETII